MAQEDDQGAEVNETLEVLCMVFIAHHQSSEVEQPSEEPFHLPPAAIAPQAPTILRLAAAPPIRGDHFRAVLVQQLLVQSVAVVGFVTDQLLRHVCHDPCVQRGRHQFHFSRRSAFCPQGERKTMAVGKTHDLGTLAAFGFPDQPPPFWPEQMSRPQNILSDPSHQPLASAAPRPATRARWLRSAPSSGTADVPSGTAHTVAAGRATEPPYVESIALRSAPSADHSTGAHARRPARGRVAKCLPRPATAPRSSPPSTSLLLVGGSLPQQICIYEMASRASQSRVRHSYRFRRHRHLHARIKARG